MSGSRLKDIPRLEREGRNLEQFAASVQEALQTFRGTRGDPLDKALTLRDAVGIGLLQINGSPGAPGGGSGGVGLPPATGGPATEPDLTPPPTPTGLTLTSGFANLFIEWAVPAYPQGHGHKKTNIYGAKYAIPGALPTFTDAIRIGEAWDSRTIYAHPTELGTNWAIWITFESIDGVESVTPAGGANGVRATIGKIDNTDLGDLIIEARNLAAMDFSNLVTNPEGRQGTSGWNDGDAIFTAVNNPGTFPYWGGLCFHMTGRDGFFGQQFAVKPKDEFVFNIQGVPDGGAGATWALLFGFQLFNAAGAVIAYQPAIVFPTGGSGVRVSGDVSFTVPDVPALPSAPAFARIWISINQPANGPYGWFFSRADIRRKPTKLAVNTIVAGDGAIAVAAIERALIALAAIDDARVANLSAGKLTVGDGTIGGNLKSANYAAGSAGWLVQPNGFCEFSGVVVRGTVFASAGVFTGTIYAAAGSIGAIQINADGLQNTGWVSATSGFKLNSNGTAEFNSGTTFRGTLDVKSAASGARQEIASSYIKVFDASNVKRIQLGDLTA